MTSCSMQACRETPITLRLADDSQRNTSWRNQPEPPVHEIRQEILEAACRHLESTTALTSALVPSRDPCWHRSPRAGCPVTHVVRRLAVRCEHCHQLCPGCGCGDRVAGQLADADLHTACERRRPSRRMVRPIQRTRSGECF